MIVHDFDRMSAVLSRYEDEAPLAIDPDRVPPRSAAMRFQSVGRWETQVLQVLGRVECGEFAPSRRGEIARHAPRQTAGKGQRGAFVAKLGIMKIRAALDIPRQ